ncbi:MAG: 30S ribosomal protein S18 [Candidatus Paceibacteria bacterium]
MNTQNQPKHVDYKNTAYLKQFMNPHGRIVGKRRSHVSATHQRDIQNAIKRARFMGLLPFVIK